MNILNLGLKLDCLQEILTLYYEYFDLVVETVPNMSLILLNIKTHL